MTPDSSFTLAPTIKVADRVIREAHIRGTERMTVRQILAESSNVGTITVAAAARRAASSRPGSTASASGSRPASTSRARAPGIVLPYDQWSGSTIGTVPIGQGIAVTPLQMVSAYAAIGNGGVMPPPHVVDEDRRQEGAARQGPPGRLAAHRRPDDRDVPRTSSSRARAPRPRSPATRSPARRAPRNKIENGRYVAEVRRVVRRARPGAKPRLAILVMVDEPHGQIYGGVVAAPIFRDIARFALQYLEVPPDAPESKRSSALVAAAFATP